MAGLLAKHRAASAAAAPTNTPAVEVKTPTVETKAQIQASQNAGPDIFASAKPAQTVAPAASMAAFETSAPVPAKAAEAPRPAPKAEVISYDPFAIITGAGLADAESVLNAMIVHSEEKPTFEGPFPTVDLQKGNSGGMFVPASNVTEEVAPLLPVARNTFAAVFLGYRLNYTAWAEQMKEGAPKSNPLYAGHVGCADVANIAALSDASEVYQFCGNKGKFDGIGHFRMGAEFLLFRKGVVFTLRLPTHYTSATRAIVALGKALPNGKMAAAPLTFSPYTTDEPGKTAWKCHSLRIGFEVSDQAKAEWAAFSAKKADLMADPEFAANLKAWNTSDVTPEALAAMKAVVGLGK